MTNTTIFSAKGEGENARLLFASKVSPDPMHTQTFTHTNSMTYTFALVSDGEGTLMLGFDNPKSLKIKCDYIKANGLLGAMYWDYEGDNEAGDLQKTLATELL